MRKKRYSLSAEAPTITRQKMTYRRRTVSDLWLPAAWSLFLSCVGGMTAFVLSGTWKATALWSLIVFGITLVASTINLMFGDFEDVLQEVEEIMGVDLDGDGKVGRPPRRWVDPVKLPVKNGGRQVLLDVDITAELVDFCKALQNSNVEAAFSEDGAALYKVKRPEFEAFRNELIGRKVIAWKNPKHPQSGYHFRDSFDVVVDYVASYPLPQEASAAQPTS